MKPLPIAPEILAAATPKAWRALVAKHAGHKDLARRVPAAIAASFEDLGKEPPFDPKTIVTRDARGYRLGVKAFVRGA